MWEEAAAHLPLERAIVFLLDTNRWRLLVRSWKQAVSSSSLALSSPTHQGRLQLSPGPRQTLRCAPRAALIPSGGHSCSPAAPRLTGASSPSSQTTKLKNSHNFPLITSGAPIISAFAGKISRWPPHFSLAGNAVLPHLLSLHPAEPTSPLGIPASACPCGHPVRGRTNPKPTDDAGCSWVLRTAAGDAPSTPAPMFACHSPTSSPFLFGQPVETAWPTNTAKNLSLCRQTTTIKLASPCQHLRDKSRASPPCLVLTRGARCPSFHHSERDKSVTLLDATGLSAHLSLAKAGQGAQHKPLLAHWSHCGPAHAPSPRLPANGGPGGPSGTRSQRWWLLEGTWALGHLVPCCRGWRWPHAAITVAAPSFPATGRWAEPTGAPQRAAPGCRAPPPPPAPGRPLGSLGPRGLEPSLPHGATREPGWGSPTSPRPQRPCRFPAPERDWAPGPGGTPERGGRGGPRGGDRCNPPPPPKHWPGASPGSAPLPPVPPRVPVPCTSRLPPPPPPCASPGAAGPPPARPGPASPPARDGPAAPARPRRSPPHRTRKGPGAPGPGVPERGLPERDALDGV